MSVDRVAAWVVLALGSVLLVGGVVGTLIAVRENEPAGAAGRLTVMVLVAFGKRRAVRQLRKRR